MKIKDVLKNKKLVVNLIPIAKMLWQGAKAIRSWYIKRRKK